MKILETDSINITILDDKMVQIDVHVDGVEIDKEKCKLAHALVANEMPGDYGVIINRKADYSIMPLDVYEVHNAHEHLKAIALVTYENRHSLPVATEQRLFNGELDEFDSIDKAREWIEQVVN